MPERIARHALSGEIAELDNRKNKAKVDRRQQDAPFPGALTAFQSAARSGDSPLVSDFQV
jgi:hypothetical protein